MKILKNIFTAIRGGASEVGEAIVNSQDMRILEQKMRDSERALEKGQDALASMMADKEKLKREIEQIKNKLDEYNGYIPKLLIDEANRELARDVAQKIAELEPEYKTRQTQLEKLDRTEEALNKQRKIVTSQVNLIKQQISSLKAQASINKAMQTAHEVLGNTDGNNFGMNSMVESIREKQQHELDKMNAQEHLEKEDSGHALDTALIQAGVLKASQLTADDVLARFKQ